MIKIKFNAAKSRFFTDAIDRKIGTAARRILSGFGARTRTRAQRSIRYRKQVSKPGMPPSAHRTAIGKRRANGKVRTVSLLREHIYFGYDEKVRGVFIGPVRLNGTTGEVLPALEYGGRSTATRWTTRSNGGLARTTKKSNRVYIRARPFMNPAGRDEERKLAPYWRNSIR